MWLDADRNLFDYRRPITITNSGSAQTDYQILVTADTQSLISAGKMRSGCQDLRFVAAVGTDYWQLNHWIESGINTSSTRIWVRVPSIPAGSSTIYMYYGNSQARSESSGDAVFDLFDDFNRSSIEKGWSVHSGSWAIESNELSGSGDYCRNFIHVGDTAWGNYVVETKVRLLDSNEEAQVAFRVQGDVNKQYQGWIRGREYDDAYIFRWTGSAIQDCSGGTSLGGAKLGFDVQQNRWYRLKAEVLGGNFKWYIDDVLKVQASDTTFSSGKVGLATWKTHAHFDDFRVRKYADPEPTASVGGEQVPVSLSSPPDGTITNAPTLEWALIGTPDNCEIWVDNDPDFSSPEIKENTTQKTYTPAGLGDENYSWRVRAYFGGLPPSSTRLGPSSSIRFPPGLPPSRPRPMGKR